MMFARITSCYKKRLFKHGRKNDDKKVKARRLRKIEAVLTFFFLAAVRRG